MSKKEKKSPKQVKRIEEYQENLILHKEKGLTALINISQIEQPNSPSQQIHSRKTSKHSKITSMPTL